MATRSAMAVLAGASVFAPQMALAEGIETTPAPTPVQESGAITFTVQPGEDLSQRQGVTVEQGSDGTMTVDYYIFRLSVTTTTGWAGYTPAGSIMAADGQSASDLVAWVSAVGTPAGEWDPNWTCMVRGDQSSVPWTPSSSTVVLRLYMKKAEFDARRAQVNQPLTFKIWIEPLATCGSSVDDDK